MLFRTGEPALDPKSVRLLLEMPASLAQAMLDQRPEKTIVRLPGVLLEITGDAYEPSTQRITQLDMRKDSRDQWLAQLYIQHLHRAGHALRVSQKEGLFELSITTPTEIQAD